ncbi:MAG: ABC transporter permease [Lachnospiraceae bacterium]|nr:ABC transporter permease [Lachnospiraceae bacterium]
MKKQRNIIRNCIPVFVILGVLVIWQGVSMTGLVPGYMLPSPIEVTQAFIADFPILMSHSKVTLLEAALGLVCGVALGFLCAALMDAYEPVRKGLYPILILTQTVPPVAIAPLLILWFSYGIAPKVVLVVLVSFFPIAIGLLEGFRSVDPDMIKLMHSMKANRWQIFWHVKFPNALGEFFSGLKIAVAYSVVGAVIAEWLGGFQGLGVYMTRVKKSYDYDKMFAVIFLVSAISLLLMAIVKVAQYKAMPWNRCQDEKQNRKEKK